MVKTVLRVGLTWVLCLVSSCTVHRAARAPLPPPQPAGPASPTVAQLNRGERGPSDEPPTRPTRARGLGAEPEGEDEPHPDSPRAAAEFFRHKRWPLGGELPVERYFEARRQARALPRFSIVEGRIRAASELRQSAAPTFGSWQSLGPGNIGGRVRDLVINPQNPMIMYAGTATGGVWKTTNGGQSWAPLTDFLPVLSVSSLAMSPADPNTLLLGTGESSRGAGIFKSSDAGQTWIQIPSTAGIYYVYKIAFVQSRPAHVYAATSSGVWISLDGGATWTQSYPPVGQSASCQSLAVRSDQPKDIVYANCQNYSNGANASAVYRNLDSAGTGTWSNVLSDPRMGNVALAVAPTQPSTVYAIAVDSDSGSHFINALLAVYRSTTGGDSGTWVIQASNTDSNPVNPNILSYPSCSYGSDHHGQGWYDLDIKVDPTNPNRVFVGGIDLFRSDDGGANWGYIDGGNGQYAHVDQHILTFHPNYNGTSNQVLYAGNDGGVFATTNAAGTSATGPKAFCDPNPSQVGWTGFINSFAATQFYHGAVFPGGAAYFGGSQDNGTSRGTDFGANNQWAYLSGGDGGDVAVDPIDANTLYSEYQALATVNLIKSTDGGVTNFDSSNGINERGSDFQFIPFFAMDPFDSLRLYVGGNILWRTLDGETTWSPASAPLPAGSFGSPQSITTIAVSPADPNLVYFGTDDGRIYYTNSALSTTGSTAWQYSRPGGGYVSRIVVDPRQPLTVYAVNSSFRYYDLAAQVFRSNDGGKTWAPLAGSGSGAFPDIPAHTLLIDPNDSSKLYVGTDIGVFASLNGGATWMQDEDPFADVITESLILDQSGGNYTLYAFTYGRGAWRVPLPGGSGSPCTYSLSTSSLNVPAIGGLASLEVNTGPTCRWVAVPGSSAGSYVGASTPIVSIQSPASGTGSGTVFLVASYNPGSSPRSGNFYIQNQAVTVNQPVDTTGSHSGFNDDRSSARPVNTLPYSDNIWNGYYTQNATDPKHSCTGSLDYRSAWWLLSPQVPGRILVSAADVYGNTGIILSAYRVTGSTLGSELGCALLAPSNTWGGSTSIQFDAIGGATYAIEISAPVPQAGSGGWVDLSVSTLPTISISPPSATVVQGRRQQFLAALSGTANPAVRWTLMPSTGTINPAGLYAAPAAVPVPAAITIVAESLANPSARATATVNLTSSAQQEIGIFRGGAWILNTSGSGTYTSSDASFVYGMPGDIPVVGDWNGDGKTKIGVYRNGTWFLDTDGNGTWDPTDAVYTYGGLPGDIPVVGDWTGDGKTKIGVYRNGTWVLDTNGNGAWDPADAIYFYGGLPGDVPVVGDWNGGGSSKLGIFRQGTWILDSNANNTYDAGDLVAFYGGLPGDLPVVGKWNGSARSLLGVYRGGIWILDSDGSDGWNSTDLVTRYGGLSADRPVVGYW